ncbi:MAG: NADP-reducing hydrogenase subunit HndA [candidate division WS2 bacterium]|nr:NADP-reducing hydrogenase subunit HndA [Candidatus Lithacetigena glycinireducens]
MDVEVKTVSGDHSERSELIPILQEVQEKEGFLSEKSLAKISKTLNISQTEIYAVATFYSQFKFNPPARHKIKVCLGTACHVKGGEKVLEAVKRSLKLENGDTTPDLKYSLERVACIGCCALAPCATIDDNVYAKLTPNKIQHIIAEMED